MSTVGEAERGEAEAAEGVRVEVEPPRGSRLVEDYLAGRPEIAPFYEGHPHRLESYRAKLEEVRGRFGREARERAAAALTPTTAGARERLRRFVEEGGAMVTTGQQAGLFGGPLYTVHKILTAVRLAEALERALGVPVLPVFWIASEDHDFAEVDHAYAVDGAGALRRVRVGAREAAPHPMSATTLDESATGAREEFLALAGTGEGSAGPALSGYRPGATVADAFQATVLSLFAEQELFVTRADDPHLKAASLPVLLREARSAAEHERRVAEQSARLAGAGYPPQVALAEGATHLFFHDPRTGRERLQRDGEGFVAPAAGRRFTAAELERELREHPGRFSPNVLLRPVVESAVFPTLAYVGGPAETAYFAQIHPLFAAFGMRMPVVFPRFSATLVPAEAERALSEIGLSRGDLALPEHELLERLARARVPAEVAERLAALRAALVEGFGAVMDAAGSAPDLELALGARRNAALLEVARAERKVVRHFKRSSPETARALRLARSHLRPLGAPQERVLTVFQYLHRRPGLLREIAEGMQVRLQED